MNKQNLKILYVSHRYHTNQVPVMKGWHEKGAYVAFWATYEGIVESHDAVDFHLMKPSWFTQIYNNRIDQKYKPVDAEGMKSSHFLPGFLDIYYHLRLLRPNLIVLRNYTICNAVIVFICRVLGLKNIIMYVQTPLYGKVNKPRWYKRILHRILFPKVCFTPVLYKGEGQNTGVTNTYPNSPKYFVPLICESFKGVLSRKCSSVIKILDVGKYREYKNHFFLIDAISNIADQYKNQIHLTIMGQLSNDNEKQYYSRLVQYVHEKNLDEIVTINGNVPYNMMDEIYSQHDILVLPSKDESAGIVVLEGLTHGLCVMSTKNNGTACYLETYQCGYTFSVENTDEIVNQLKELLNNPSKIEFYKEKGRIVAQQQLSFKNYLKAINEITMDNFGLTVL